MQSIRYVECPRDAWQGFQQHIPSEAKRGFLNTLLEAGFKHLDLASFVSPRAVPQMADSEAVLADLVRPEDCDFIAIIVNQRGLERALKTNISTFGFPLSVNETFQKRNAQQSLVEAWQLLEHLWAQIREAGRGLVVYLSMAFGNPYGENWAATDTSNAVAQLRAMGIGRIALADTMGSVEPQKLHDVLSGLEDTSSLGLHLHSLPERWQAPLLCALEHGIRWFEGALGGIGGCPFAADSLIANIPSEAVLPFLQAEGFELAMDLSDLDRLAMAAKSLSSRYA
jgi:hydroxymethylglutaryl-CoA lyase